MNTVSLRGSARLIGGLTILTPLAMGVSFGLLGLTFDYPAVMDRPAAEVLRKVHDAGGAVPVYWLAVTLAACALLAVSVALPTVVAPARERGIGAMTAAAGGVAALMTIMDVGQWVWLYPHMADRWARGGAALRGAIEQDWSNFHQLLGVGIGRYLATLFSAIWAVGVGALMLSDSRWPRVLGWAGVVAGLLFLASALPGLSFDAWAKLNTAGFVVWLVWLVGSGLLLAGIPRGSRAT
ncbi:MAG TPA: DUF4386 family protein [Solirubrobacteraceae bacterium]|nr:DUF4386 family protein [Solirubrobacteraceae bacterium]